MFIGALFFIFVFIFVFITLYFFLKKNKKNMLYDEEVAWIMFAICISILIFIASPFRFNITKLNCSSYVQVIETTPFDNFHIGKNTLLTNSSNYTFEVFSNTIYPEDKIISVGSFTFNVENNNGNSKITTVLYDNKPFSYK